MADVSQTLKDTSKSTSNDIKKMSNDAYLKKIRSKLQNLEFPSDFNAWTVKEQSNWMHHNVTELYQNVPETLQYVIPAMVRPVDFNRSQEKLPEWIDMDKYRRGQKFVRDNYFSFIYSILLGSIYSFTFNDGVKPFLVSGKTATPYLAFKRFLNTIVRMLSWYNGEPWVKRTKAYMNMEIARSKHTWINKKMCRMSNEEILAVSEIEYSFYLERETLLKDAAVMCPFVNLEQRPYKLTENSLLMEAINNAAVSVGQACFIMLSIIYPQNIGIHNATDEDLEAFCHMWRCYGYFLGLEDEYNFCRGSLEEIKQRLWDLDQHWIKVNFMDFTPEWMHISRNLTESLNYYPFMYMTHKTITLLLAESLNLKMPNLYASLKYGEWIVYNVYKFLICHGLKFPIIRRIINFAIYKIIETASNFGPETLAKLQEKSKQYMDFSNKS